MLNAIQREEIRIQVQANESRVESLRAEIAEHRAAIAMIEEEISTLGERRKLYTEQLASHVSAFDKAHGNGKDK